MPSPSRRRQSRMFRKPKSGGARGSGRQSFSTATMPRKRSGSTIPFQKFLNEAIPFVEAAPYEPTHRFADFDLDERVKANVSRKGYEVPTAIQDQSIPHVLAGRDVIGLANTGTGKTASFVLPIINKLLHSPRQLALIVAPTRELAQQIDEEFRSFAAGLKLHSAVCVGGVREGSQIAALKRHPEVVIGTPGRLKQFIDDRVLDISAARTFVLDEADRMLDMGFIRDMEYIMGHLPQERQSLCFSATMTPDIERIVSRLLTDPITVSVRTTQTSQHIQQDVVHVRDRAEKVRELENIIAKTGSDKVLVFGETKYGVQRLSEKLTKAGIKAEAIHGNKNQNQRQRALDAFKAGRAQVLVATDVAARGLDIPSVTHVINYDPPKTYDDYIHRIGRTGRAGKGGHAVTFVAAGPGAS